MVIPPASASGRFRLIRAILTVSLCLFLLWVANPWHYYFLNDDFLAIPRVANGQFIYGDLMRPVSDLTLWMDHFLWQKDPAGYHVTNLLIHLVNSSLIFLLSREFVARFRNEGQHVIMKPWLASLLFLLYSSHGEPLFWIIGRGGSLGTLFCLVSCICLLRRDRSHWYPVICLASFLLGLLTYESVWVFPLIATWLVLAAPGQPAGAETPGGLEKGRRAGSAGFLLAGIAGLFVLYLLFRRWETGAFAGAYELRDLASGKPGRLFYNYNTLLARCMLPPMADGKWFAGSYLFLLALLTAALLLVSKRRKAGRLCLILAVGLLLALLPAIGLGIDTHTTESERFIYLPSVFWVLLLVEGLSVLITRPAIFLRVCVLVILANGFGLWRTSLSYRFAGEVVQSSLSCIDAGGPGETAGVDSSILYARGLPSQYEGALIFRRGFEDAVHWMLPGYGRYAIRILSRTTLHERRDELTCEESDPVRGLRSMHAVNLNRVPPGAGKPQGEYLVDLGDTSFSFEPGKDQMICWTDSSILRFGR
ncbi:MAG: hypothetical protein Q8927_20305 [Bacteroidota bacterium]|nr:hypothetical protein [Bacteroidota bacterium]MDP4218549.1 hypothetical protein [Bacteroidota bacterium]MDP4255119.1 hypothetical protein [Bacteroidota bacterium]